MKITLSIILFFSLFEIAFANDKRIRLETYSKDMVYNIYTEIGRATLIQLEDDESLSDSSSSVLGIGDAEAWNLAVRGNNIVLKPAKKMPNTNIIVVTNKRTYAFDLMETKKNNPSTYLLRFFYPDTQAKLMAVKDSERLNIKEDDQVLVKLNTVINTNYNWRGTNKALKPTAIFDNGRFTYLMYDDARELPVFFKILPDNKEGLINSHVDGADKSLIVLHDVVQTIRVRLGNELIEIINKNYKVPRINNSGSSANGAVRQDIGIVSK
jgi:type IV secretion system protein VirB9